MSGRRRAVVCQEAELLPAIYKGMYWLGSPGMYRNVTLLWSTVDKASCIKRKDIVVNGHETGSR